MLTAKKNHQMVLKISSQDTDFLNLYGEIIAIWQSFIKIKKKIKGRFVKTLRIAQLKGMP